MIYGSVLVTGAAGLVGGAVARRLLSEGARVAGTDMQNTEGLDCPFFTADLADARRLQAILREHPVEAIVHCGGVSGSMLFVDNPLAIVQANVLGTVNVLEVARTSGIRRLVFCSSASVYGATPPDPVVEEAALHPLSVYGASKIAGEALLEAYAAQWSLDAVALRIFQVYGPGRTTECQIRSMLMGGLLKQSVRLRFAPETMRQYVFIDDVVTAVVRALEAQVYPRRSYNVCGDTSLSLTQIAALVAQVVPGVDIRFEPTRSSPANARGSVDIAAATRDLGFVPKVSLQDGINRYATWLRNRLPGTTEGRN